MSMTLTQPPSTDLPRPTDIRWRPLRAGLQNVWQYDHTTRFNFHAGRLLLRGRNGVGKTKVVEVLLPFLLEGRMQPSRLDPFGTRSRRMHFNLLHDGNADQQSAVAYVWLEFGRLDDDGQPQFATIGAGLKARRTSDAVESWFFTISQRRVDLDLDLIDATRTPLSRPNLVEALGDDGHVVETARDHRQAVNRLLFGVPDTQYEAMVDALLRLRQPHLSERLEPDEVGTVLSDSLPPLDTDKVTEVAEGFERMEAHRRDLADRRRSLAAVGAFLDVYADYATVVAAAGARELTRAEYQRTAASESVTAAAAAHAAAETQRDQLGARSAHVDDEITAGRTRITTLQTSDAYRAVQDLEKAEERQRQDRERLVAAETQLQDSEESVHEAETDLAAAAREVTTQTDAVGAAQRQAIRAAGDADLVDEHHGASGALVAAVLGRDDPDAATSLDLRGELSATRGACDAVATSRQRAIEAVRDLSSELERALAGHRRTVDAVAHADDAVLRADEVAMESRNANLAATEAFTGAVQAWSDGNRLARLDDAELEDVMAVDPEVAHDDVRRRRDDVRERLDRTLADVRAALTEIESARDDVEAEHDRLHAATHQPPEPPSWRTADRTDRPGAPLYLLAEFSETLTPPQQANVEAALGAAGLLDAWVMPDGRVLDDGMFDVALLTGPALHGRTLADVMRVTAVDGVPAQVVRTVMSRIAVGDDSSDADVGALVGTDGSFVVGPLSGRAAGERVQFLGATARERERQRRLDDLRAELDRLGQTVAESRQALDTAVAERELFDTELAAFPSARQVVAARADERAAARDLTAARERRGQAAEAETRAAAVVDEARDRRAEVAAEVGLAAHVDRLDELAVATRAWVAASWQLVSTVEHWGYAHAGLARARVTTDRAQVRRDADSRATQGLRQTVVATTAEVETLSSMVGADRDELRDELRTIRDRVAAHEVEQRDLVERRQQVAETVGVTRSALATAESDRDDATTVRDDAATRFGELAGLGLLVHFPGLDTDGDPEGWGVTTALEHARAVGRAGPELPDDADSLRDRVEAEENSVSRRQSDLQRELVAGVRLLPRRTHGVLVYDVQESGRTSHLAALAADLAADVASREDRLRGDEQELLESFLTGELHEHLRTRIRDAGELVDVMNDQLAQCATTAGHRVRLRWRVAEDAPPGTGQAIELLLRGRALITDDQRRDLRSFLHERLREARDGEAAASLFERIAGAFDYRRWYAFTVEVRDGSSTTWRRLTRQSHGAGSGGEKAVMLHLPLFAAMAAHYHGSPSSPRLIVLDEVFAGIDRETRGQLMGLLVDLDLDALLTSHDEWGFYAELDGMSTYHLMRDPGVPGVLGEWFVWDGSTRWEMGS